MPPPSFFCVHIQNMVPKRWFTPFPVQQITPTSACLKNGVFNISAFTFLGSDRFPASPLLTRWSQITMTASHCPHVHLVSLSEGGQSDPVNVQVRSCHSSAEILRDKDPHTELRPRLPSGLPGPRGLHQPLPVRGSPPSLHGHHTGSSGSAEAFVLGVLSPPPLQVAPCHPTWTRSRPAFSCPQHLLPSNTS